ncbi:hypothetical protein Q9966_014085 [Columba livia]|nr:hypothetical protein Q9966_014085 [Columba livia]
MVEDPQCSRPAPKVEKAISSRPMSTTTADDFNKCFSFLPTVSIVMKREIDWSSGKIFVGRLQIALKASTSRNYNCVYSSVEFGSSAGIPATARLNREAQPALYPGPADKTVDLMDRDKAKPSRTSLSSETMFQVKAFVAHRTERVA